MIVIVDYGMGNLHSVKRALDYAVHDENKDIAIKISSNAADILNASHLILPGQGGIADCMRALQNSKLEDALRTAIQKKIPTLGICVGMQMLFEQSEEGQTPTECLGLLSGKIKKFKSTTNINDNTGAIKVPHMGWNTIRLLDNASSSGSNLNTPTVHKIWQNIPNDSYFYFIHSYYLEKNALNTQHAIAECNYTTDFICAVACDNIIGMQFHPEKSAKYGLQIYQNFINLCA
jgi:imidazole glycerol-phosphate synthase subunit HisH